MAVPLPSPPPSPLSKIRKRKGELDPLKTFAGGVEDLPEWMEVESRFGSDGGNVNRRGSGAEGGGKRKLVGFELVSGKKKREKGIGI